MGTAMPESRGFNESLHLLRGMAILLTCCVYRRSVWLPRLAMGDWKQPAASAAAA